MRFLIDKSSQKSVLGSSKTITKILGHVKYLFLHSPQLKNYLLSFTLTKFALIRSVDSVCRHIRYTYIYEWGRPWFKYQASPNLGKGVLRGQNSQNRFFLSQSMKDTKLYNILKNQPLGSFKRVDMREVFLFWPWKGAESLISLLQIELGNWNLIGILGRGHIWAFLGYRLFRAPLHLLAA